MASTLIDQIDAELQSIRKKLAGPSNIGALVAVLVADIATTSANITATSATAFQSNESISADLVLIDANIP
jgi:hypothetical protein